MRLTLGLTAGAILLMVGSYIQMSISLPPPPPGPDPRVDWWQDGGGVQAPDFKLATLDGDTLSLSDLSGNIVVLNFWATWCAPCRRETPAFVRLREEFKHRGIRFVGVSVDEGGGEIVRAFVKHYGVTYPVVIDNGTVKPGYEEVTGLPTTFVLDREGRIDQFMPGEVPEGQLRWMLERMIEAKPLPEEI